MKQIFGTSKSEADEEQWLSVSDLMAGLMVIFLFIAISYMRPIQKLNADIKEIATAWENTELDIHEELRKEFQNDLDRWNAEIDPETLTFRFKSPDVLFESGKPELRPEFQQIIIDFFPRYINVLMRFSDSIEEVRIEGHTDPVWQDARDEYEAYFNNMSLSQQRTRSVLEFGLSLSVLSADDRLWARRKITANGLSSSRPIYALDGTEDHGRSRRVEFRVVTNASERIGQILESLKQ